MDPIAAADELLDLGFGLQGRGEHAFALEIYREAARIAPTYARAHMNVGNALQQLGRIDDALAAFQEALRVDPAFAPARFNSGMLLLAIGQEQEAEREFHAAIRDKPDLVEAYVALADVEETRGKLELAIANLRHALELRPRFAGAAYNLGMALQKANRFEEAETALLDAMEFDPIAARGALNDYCWNLNYRADLDPRVVFAEHVRAGEAIARRAGAARPSRASHVRRDRIRVGYVSGDFRLHPVGVTMKRIVAAHDRDAFAIHCYSNNPFVDHVTRSIRQSVDSWRDIDALDDAAVCESIRDDAIDILVDLAGHSKGSRLAVFARRAAPVQLTWLGYLNTSGLRNMDYRLCDHHTDPAGESDSLHTEKLIRLPHSQWCYFPLEEVDLPPSKPSADFHADVVFGSFNQFRKIGDECLALWCRVLSRVPKSRLIVFDVDNQRLRRRLLDSLAACGVEADRVSMHGRSSVADYFRTLASVDIALDTFPYNGATTTLDALWMGTPVVALKGDRSIARGAFSILQSIGLTELCATSADEYVEINVRLALDGHRRASLARSLRPMLERSPLMDAPRFVAALEAAYREMWKRWCAGE